MKRIMRGWREWFGFIAPVLALLGGAIPALLLSAGPAAAQQPIAINVPPPELVGGPWLNTAEKASITLASRQGKVTILHFWTFG